MTRHRTPSTPAVLRAPITTRLGAFGLAAVITGSVLMGLGGTADQQFDQALLAQSRVCTPQLAGTPSVQHAG
jgi:hypothetical protein